MLRSFGERASELLSEYVNLHDHMLNASGTFRSLFRSVDFGDLLKRSQALRPGLSELAKALERFHDTQASDLSSEGRAFLTILEEHVGALQDTVSTLIDRQHAAFEASKSARCSNLTWADFKRLNTEYEASIEKYIAVGKRLHEAGKPLYSD